MIKIAINGFGRIGRPAFRRILDNHPNLEIAAINDLADPKTLGHLVKYDSVYGIYQKSIKAGENSLLIDGTGKGKKVQVFSEIDPQKLPWKELGIDVVLECTGNFTDYQGAKKHIIAGAKRVIISAPSRPTSPATCPPVPGVGRRGELAGGQAKSEEIKTYVLGVNENIYNPEQGEVASMGSCTTNCLAPIVKVLNENFKILRGFMTTIHSYTNDQRILDLPHKDLRRARAAALNIIPTTTGAASAIGSVIPELKGKLDGIALRVPTPAVSVLDLICEVEKKASAEEVNYAFKKASEKEGLRGILGIEDALLVSSDYIGNCFSAIVDASLTMANENLVKVVAWYDNEWAYACRLAEFAEFVGKKL